MLARPIRNAWQITAVLAFAACLGTAQQRPAEHVTKAATSRTVLVRVSPEYPRVAASMKLMGAVQLEATVRADGTVRDVKVLGGHPVLAEAATNAVKRWRYEPSSKETTELVRITFEP